MPAQLSRTSWVAIGSAAALICSGPAFPSPSLVANFRYECAITLEANSAPDVGKVEIALGPLAAALLTSAADAVVGFGIDLIKTKLDPSQGQYSDKIVIPYKGMFSNAKHNPDLGCLMVAVFDPTSSADFPGKWQKDGEKLPSPDFGFKNLRVPSKRFASVFGDRGAPIIYLEAVRIFSPDGTAHYYQPVYAYVSKMAKPHMLSKDPVWELTMSWRDFDDKPFAGWTYKFNGEPPLELDGKSLSGTARGWSALAKLTKDTRTTGVAAPFTVQIELVEHRTATLFAKALQAAVNENEAAIKQGIKDQYPWRREEVKAQAAEALTKADGEARTRLATYLTALDSYTSDCKAPATEAVRAQCSARYTLLQRTQAAAQADVAKFQILPDGQTVPAPAPPGPVASG
jgi:hypothetical protein